MTKPDVGSPTQALRRLHRWRMALAGFVILVAGITLGAAGTMLLVKPVERQPPRDPDVAAQLMSRRVQEELGLSPEQVKQIESILRTHMGELEALRKDGSEFPIEISVSPIRLQGGWWAVAVLRDITERKRAEQVIKKEQQLLRQMLDLHERERKLVSYEIHDGLAQMVTGALMNFEAFSQLREQNPQEAQKLFERGHESLSESIAEARRLISGLRPPVLDESGVVAAIDYLVYENKENSGLEIDFSHHVDFDRLAPPLESALFRVAQETLTNAIRHSKTDKVRIELVQSADQVQLAVQDWGIGFDPATVGEDCQFGKNAC